MKRLMGLLVLAGLGAPACAPMWPYSTMASHTVRVASDRDSDVVWVQRQDGMLYRCFQGAEGPACQTVKKN
jgi:hypothetical protein